MLLRKMEEPVETLRYLEKHSGLSFKKNEKVTETLINGMIKHEDNDITSTHTDTIQKNYHTTLQIYFFYHLRIYFHQLP